MEPQTRNGVTRFLEDLRSGADRRAWFERRRPRFIRDPDWRGEDRRLPRRERRSSGHDRRRPPAGVFAPADHERIAAILADPSLRAECPRCGARLLRSEAVRGGRPLAAIHCTGCGRRAEMA